MAFSEQVKDLIANLAKVHINDGKDKESFMKEVEKIYDEVKWLLNGVE